MKLIESAEERHDYRSIGGFDMLRFFKYVLQKRKILISIVLVLLVASVIYVQFVAVPLYEATAQIYVVNSKESVINLSDLQIGSYLASDYQWMFTTWEVNQQVINNLKLPYTVKQMKERLTVSNPSNTRILLVTFLSPDAKEAAAVANEYAAVACDYISDYLLTDKPTIVSVALQPLSPVRPRKMVVIGASVLIGFVLTLWVMFFMYLYGEKITTPDDLRKYAGVEPMATIPIIEKRKTKI